MANKFSIKKSFSKARKATDKVMKTYVQGATGDLVSFKTKGGKKVTFNKKKK